METGMKRVGVVTDSHSGITQKQAKEMGILVLPMPFSINGKDFLEDVTLSRKKFFERLIEGAEVSTSQPSPADVTGIWNKALAEFEEIVYIPISSGLSGACMTAMALSGGKSYQGKVFVVDNGRVSTPMRRSVMDALELVQEGYGAAQIKQMLEAAKARMQIYVAVDTLEYLRKGGRISRTTAAIGTVMNIKPVLKFDIGALDTYKKCRGFGLAKKAMIEAMRHDLETVYAEEMAKGEVYLLAASSASDEVTAKWVQEIEAAFPGMEVLCDNLALGISCHIGPNGLGIGCSCRPKRI